jgi:hypothetical protein
MKKLIVTAFSIVIVLTSVYYALGQSDDESPNLIEYIVIADTANLRSGPGTSFEVVATAVRADILLIYDEEPEEEGWLKVFIEDEDDAYVADFLVERAPVRFYPVGQEPILTVSGRGSNATEVFDIPRGAYRIDAVVEDQSFILETIVVEGDCRDSHTFNELNFNANQLIMSGLFVSTGCSVIFQTDNVDGDWSFEVRDIIDEEFFESSLLAIEDGTIISGQGRALTMPTFLPEGVWTISAEVDDNSFILRPQVLNGDCETSTVFNEFDSDVDTLEVSSVYRSSDDGCVIFWETSNLQGEWIVTFEQVR